jgi:hypothetical protein
VNEQLTPDQLVTLYQTAVQQAHLEQEARWARARLYLILSTAGLIATLALLKMEGPWYVDAIIAAAFLGQGMSAIVFAGSLGRREGGPYRAGRVRSLEAQLGLAAEAESGAPERRDPIGAAFSALTLLAILHFGACGLTLWLTFFAPPEIPVEEEAVTGFVPSVAALFCSRSGR